MMLRFWKPVAGAILLALAVWAIHHHGYTAGVAHERGIWEPRFQAAEKARATADARAAAVDEASRATRLDLEKSHASTVRDLETAAAASGVRINRLLRDLAARPGSCPVPEVAGSADAAARTAEVERRLGEIGERIAGVGRDCASDAAIVRLWQQWHERESSLR